MMKKILGICIFLLSAAAAADAQGTDFHRKYRNFSWSQLTMTFDGEPKQKSELGFAFTSGRTYFLHGKPIAGMLKIGIDATWVDLGYTKYSAVRQGEGGPYCLFPLCPDILSEVFRRAGHCPGRQLCDDVRYRRDDFVGNNRNRSRIPFRDMPLQEFYRKFSVSCGYVRIPGFHLSEIQISCAHGLFSLRLRRLMYLSLMIPLRSISVI